MSTLLVIGNGFDLSVGANTSYNHFFESSFYKDAKREINSIIAEFKNSRRLLYNNDFDDLFNCWDVLFCIESKDNLYNNKDIDWCDIEKVIHDKLILESLVASYVKAPSEELASVVKDVLHLVESDLVGIKFLLENKVFTENVVYAEEVKILKDYYSSVVDLAERINSF